MPHAATEFLTTIWRALDGETKSDARVEFNGEGALPSVFAITDLAAASIGAARLHLKFNDPWSHEWGPVQIGRSCSTPSTYRSTCSL
jgi:hypothetical protein